MPRGLKSKLRAREKRRHNRAQTQGLHGSQAAEAEEEETSSPSSPACEDGPSTSAVAGTVPAPPSVPATTSAAAGVSCKRSDAFAMCHVKKSKNSSQASTSTESSVQDLLTTKVNMLVQFLLFKYKMNEPIKKADMLKIVHKSYRQQFPEILQKASEHMIVVFGLELMEVKPNSQSYTLVRKQDDTNDGSQSSAWQFPPRGILMPLLGVIFLRHNSAPEEDIWEILNMWGIYDGKRHVIFGEPRKLIEDLVKEKYLGYREVPNTDLPPCEYLWRPRAQTETTKMQVLEFLCNINGTAPSDFPCHYEQALRDEEQRARATAATMAGTASKSSGVPRATSSR
ncbi:melanoma-associated antigen B4-like [Rhinolophus ferrumequinum]|uniref:melanoma-associated antigen B4-like n=1 Tax=Rhinolophus ferrumequinum TaxID=59479 RepID=UPI00140F9ED4|nr:melanoma-associated antigen B4-like [Rhinolophus ferrumequinum]